MRRAARPAQAKAFNEKPSEKILSEGSWSLLSSINDYRQKPGKTPQALLALDAQSNSMPW